MANVVQVTSFLAKTCYLISVFQLQLEKMKNENLLTLVDDCNLESSFPGLQRELMQLHEVMESICMDRH